MRRRLVALAATTVLLLLAACSGGGKKSVLPGAKDEPVQTVLAIGDRATEGDGIPDRLHNAWPYLVYNDRVPRSAVFVNGALDDATVASVLEEQTVLARELKPDVVEMWIGADNLREGTPPGAFATGLTVAIDTLRSYGTRRIVVADLPIAYGDVTAYNAEIQRVVSETKTELVPLHRVEVTLNQDQPDTASHRRIADTFAAQIRRQPAP